MVGMRQTNSAMRTASRDPAGPRRSRRAAAPRTRCRKMIVNFASRIDRAISLGVFCRSAPSTSAIIRSRNVSPGSAVIPTLIQSDSTFVPPVTAERSPPDSRMTGADSPVMADSSTEAMPSMMSPSPGISSPASTITTSPARSSEAGMRLLGAVGPEAPARPGLPASAQRVGLGLASPLGHRLGEVGEHHREPQPEGDRRIERDRSAAGDVDRDPDHHDDGDDLDHEDHGIAQQRPRVELPRLSTRARLTMGGSNSGARPRRPRRPVGAGAIRKASLR